MATRQWDIWSQFTGSKEQGHSNLEDNDRKNKVERGVAIKKA